MAKMTDYAEKALLDFWFRNTDTLGIVTPYLAWFDGNVAPPDDAGTTTGEITEISREAVTFSAASARSIAMSGVIDIDLTGAGLPTDKPATHAAIMDAATAGNMLAYGDLTPTLQLNDGDPLRMSAITWDFPDTNAALVDAVVNAWLDHMFGVSQATMPTGWTIPLYTGDPGQAGSANEVTGTGYAPAAVTWDVVDPHQTDATRQRTKNSGALNWSDLDAQTLAWWGVRDQLNNFLARSDQTDKILSQGSNAQCAAGTLIISVA